MFTGLIQDIGTIRTIDERDGLTRVEIACGFDMNAVALGASIACNGCCLTAVEMSDDSFTVEASLETLDVTNLKEWTEGFQVNLEPSLKMGDEMGGHIVSGHVDALAELLSVTPEGESYCLRLSVPQDYAHYIAPKGSVALDGISLTVNQVEGNEFAVMIIPHTWDHTNLSSRKVGDKLNFEVDVIARYVARMTGKE